MRILWIAALVLILGCAHAQALESAPVTSQRATVTLLSETDSYRRGQDVRVGLHVRLAPGWHIYWQNPGDAGTPPDITWSLPAGAKAGGIAWPAPDHETQSGITSYVYTGEVVLPVRITPPDGRGLLDIQADASWLVCSNICVPEEGHFRLSLPAGSATPGSGAALFAAADAKRPQPNPFEASVAPDGALRVAGAGLSAATVQDAWFFPSAWGSIDQNAPEALTVEPGALTLRLKPGAQFQPTQGLNGLLVLHDPHGSESYLDLHATPAAATGSTAAQGSTSAPTATAGSTATPGPASAIAPPAAVDAAPLPASISLSRALLLALAGGLILNLMPCVFPVLAMKALAIARLSGHHAAIVRAQSLSYTAGVLLAFLALGGVLLGLRASGSAMGWGFQFQSPAFVAFMAWLLFAIGLNLSGVFEVGGRFAGAGQSLAGRGGHLGSFGSGLLAVLVATPCTAPFMSGAMAAAALAPPAAALGIFAALGVGLALPYVLLAVFPKLADMLPRPGEWMQLLREALAFPMYGAAIWLLWVASQQSGSTGVLLVAGGMGLLGFGGWLLGRAQRTDGWRRHAGLALAAIAALAALALLPTLGTAAPEATPNQVAGGRGSDGAEPFSDSRLAALRAQGRPVFIDMTAAWCVTCLVNERVALAPQSVRDAFAAHDVVYMKGDWTRQDPAITRFLRAAGHDGVPLYVYYPPRGQPVVLPQVLTPSLVLAQLQPSPQ